MLFIAALLFAVFVIFVIYRSIVSDKLQFELNLTLPGYTSHITLLWHHGGLSEWIYIIQPLMRALVCVGGGLKAPHETEPNYAPGGSRL